MWARGLQLGVAALEEQCGLLPRCHRDAIGGSSHKPLTKADIQEASFSRHSHLAPDRRCHSRSDADSIHEVVQCSWVWVAMARGAATRHQSGRWGRRWRSCLQLTKMTIHRVSVHRLSGCMETQKQICYKQFYPVLEGSTRTQTSRPEPHCSSEVRGSIAAPTPKVSFHTPSMKVEEDAASPPSMERKQGHKSTKGKSVHPLPTFLPFDTPLLSRVQSIVVPSSTAWLRATLLVMT